MNYEHIASALFDRPLAVAEGKARMLTNVLLGRIMPDAPRADIVDDDLTARHSARGTPTIHTRDDVAVIEVVGTLVQRGGWIGASSGLTSYQGLRTQIEEARDDPGVKAIALEIDSPGGEVAGLPDLADVIRAAREVKPVRAYVADLAASAAYVLASQASEVIVSRTSMVGSMGALMVHYDISAALQEAGVRPTIISSGRRKSDFAQELPLAEAALTWAQSEVDQARDMISEIIASGRGDSLNKAAALATEAGLFTGQAAVAAGLADRVGDPAQEFRAWVADITAASPAAPTAAAKGKHMSMLSNAGTGKAAPEKKKSANRTVCGINAGANLARVLNDAIESEVESRGEDATEADVIGEMAEAAGISPSTVNQILSGDINCPPIQRLQGFAEVLDVTVDDLTSAGEEDGCNYSAEDDDDDAPSAVSERERISAILEAPEAEGREALAKYFALKTDMDAAAARAALKAAAKEQTVGGLSAKMQGLDPASPGGEAKAEKSVLSGIVQSEMMN